MDMESRGKHNMSVLQPRPTCDDACVSLSAAKTNQVAARLNTGGETFDREIATQTAGGVERGGGGISVQGGMGREEESKSGASAELSRARSRVTVLHHCRWRSL